MPVTSETKLTQYYYGNSLVNFAGGNAFSNGSYGFLQQFADRTEPANEWGFSGTDGLWDTDVAEFVEVTFDQIIITPANFIQEANAATSYFGTTTSPLSAKIDTITDTLVAQPDAEFFIYEGWSDLGLFSEAFPPSDSVMENYYSYNQAEYHDWYVSYVDALQAEFPDTQITLIPVAPVLAGLLSADGPLGSLDVTDLFVDTAPHGTETLYFLASLINYQATVGAPVAADFPIPASINALLTVNFAAIVDFIETESAVFANQDDTSDPDVNTIIGTESAELIDGTADADSIEASGGNDTVNGNAGDDVANGDAGNDRLSGGTGNDTLNGGAGADVFVFATGHGRDYLYDFEDGTDLIDITGLELELTTLLLSGSVNETIAAGTSFIFENNSDSIQIYNNTSTAITLSIDDFIYDNVLIVG